MLNNLEEAGERINLLVRETFENGKLQNFLDTLAKMPNISYGNCLLLKNQLEDVSKVLPKEVWEKYGKQINELAEPLQIIKYVKDGENTQYKLQEVYDVSQTDSMKVTKGHDKKVVSKIMDNMQKKLDEKYRIRFEKKEYIDETIRQIIFTMNDFSNNGDSIDFVDNIRFVVEPTIYTIEKHFGFETTNNNDIKHICMWGIDQDNDKLKNGLKDIQRMVNAFIKEFEREQKKFLININYKTEEQESN